jgi:ParB/RepB/Spo0J family partition protein
LTDLGAAVMNDHDDKRGAANLNRLVEQFERGEGTAQPAGRGGSVELRKVAELRPHPDQVRVYGDEPDEGLIESVKKDGVHQPLLITKDDIIVSGFRRWSAAKKAGRPDVPVIIFASSDPLDVREAFIDCNRQREKTSFQKCREAIVLKEVEEERAKTRQAEAAMRAGVASGASRRGETNVREKLPGRSEEVRARDKVGEALGVSGRTAEKMVVVGKAADEAERNGDKEKAEKLKEVVNNRGVDTAFRLVRTQKEGDAEAAKDRKKATSAVLDFSYLDSLLKQLREGLSKLVKKCGEAAVRKWCKEHGIDYDTNVKGIRPEGREMMLLLVQAVNGDEEATKQLVEAVQTSGHQEAADRLLKLLER